MKGSLCHCYWKGVCVIVTQTLKLGKISLWNTDLVLLWLRPELRGWKTNFPKEVRTSCYRENGAENIKWADSPGSGADGSPLHLPKFTSRLRPGRQPASRVHVRTHSYCSLLPFFLGQPSPPQALPPPRLQEVHPELLPSQAQVISLGKLSKALDLTLLWNLFDHDVPTMMVTYIMPYLYAICKLPEGRSCF